MRISELARTSGVPVATIKYYLREGILPPGQARGATQADYGDEHVRRLGLIRSLADLAGLPIARIKEVLALIDHPSGDLFETLGKAIEALPPYAGHTEAGSDTGEGGGEGSGATGHPLAKAALDRLGWNHDEDFAANAQLERALAAVADAGIPLTDDRLLAYGEALHRLAEFDLQRMPGPGTQAPNGGEATASGPSASAAVEYAVLGTALYEPVIVALRRLAHQDVASRMLQGG